MKLNSGEFWAVEVAVPMLPLVCKGIVSKGLCQKKNWWAFTHHPKVPVLVGTAAAPEFSPEQYWSVVQTKPIFQLFILKSWSLELGYLLLLVCLTQSCFPRPQVPFWKMSSTGSTAPKLHQNQGVGFTVAAAGGFLQGKHCCVWREKETAPSAKHQLRERQSEMVT